MASITQGVSEAGPIVQTSLALLRGRYITAPSVAELQCIVACVGCRFTTVSVDYGKAASPTGNRQAFVLQKHPGNLCRKADSIPGDP
jgi:hypothetical protein